MTKQKELFSNSGVVSKLTLRILGYWWSRI